MKHHETLENETVQTGRLDLLENRKRKTDNVHSRGKDGTLMAPEATSCGVEVLEEHGLTSGDDTVLHLKGAPLKTKIDTENHWFVEPFSGSMSC